MNPFRSKLALSFSFLISLVLFLSACFPTAAQQAEPETIIVTQIVEVPVEAEPQPAGAECCAIYRIGITEEPSTTNYWRGNGPEALTQNAYVLNGYAGALYTLSDQSLRIVPLLANQPLPSPVQEAGVWTVTVEMVSDAKWSDGEPITAHDVAFTANTSIALQLFGNWASWYPFEVLERVEALDDSTVKFIYRQQPGLAQWQEGPARAPILAQHYWEPIAAEALALVEGLDSPGPPPAEDATEEEVASYETALEAYTRAREVFYAPETPDAPGFGAMLISKFEQGAFIEMQPNPHYYFKGAEIVEYEDGTWMRLMLDGDSWQFFGEASGAETLRFTKGPHAPAVIFSIYPDQNSAVLALLADEIDAVLDPQSLPSGIEEELREAEGIRIITNEVNGFFYLAFNFRREVTAQPAFRQAVDILINKEFLTQDLFQGRAIPMYSVVPPANRAWHNAGIPTPQLGLSRQERVEIAAQVLAEAGWTWDLEPSFNEETGAVEAGQGLRTPDGLLVTPLQLLGPSSTEDAFMSSATIWIAQWLAEFGIPIEAEVTSFANMFTPVFFDFDFDMYILGWGLSIYPDYLHAFFHSSEAIPNGNNTPGMTDPAYDQLAEDFLAETDLERAYDLAFELQEQIAEIRPYIPLYTTRQVDAVRATVQLPYTEVLGGLTWPGVSGFITDARPLILP